MNLREPLGLSRQKMRQRGAVQKQKGFTLVELILVIALIAIIAASSIPLLGNVTSQNRTNATAREVVSALRLAQQKAMAGNQDSEFGVYFDDINKEFTVFRGASYGVNPSDDITFDYEDSVVVSQSFAGDEVNIQKLTGSTSDVGTIAISDSSGSSEAITISSQGKIELQ